MVECFVVKLLFVMDVIWYGVLIGILMIWLFGIFSMYVLVGGFFGLFILSLVMCIGVVLMF